VHINRKHTRETQINKDPIKKLVRVANTITKQLINGTQPVNVIEPVNIIEHNTTIHNVIQPAIGTDPPDVTQYTMLDVTNTNADIATATRSNANNSTNTIK